MTNASKAKGSAWESKLRDYLNERGVKAGRIPAGASKDVGDLWCPGGWVVEAKNTKSFTPSSFLNETLAEQKNAGLPWAVAAVKRVGKSSAAEGYALMTIEQLASIMLELDELDLRRRHDRLKADEESDWEVFMAGDGQRSIRLKEGRTLHFTRESDETLDLS